MMIKTQYLTARALDWAVGVAVGADLINGGYAVSKNDRLFVAGLDYPWSPTTNWGQLGPLLSSYGVSLTQNNHMEATPDAWSGRILFGSTHMTGSCPEVAACRAIVHHKIGDQVDVPEVLCQTN